MAQKVVLLLFLIFSVWLGFNVIQPPDPQPKSSHPAEFSAERAFSHVKQIAQQPHPLGSTYNDSVRTYIMTQLENLGLDPEIQEGIGVAGRFGSGRAGHTTNIIAQIDGRDPEKTILLMTHYDSAPNAPGAADDGSGVAAILESVRALQAQEEPLKNNVLILITDGEERGLLGAELFVDQFKQLDQIDLVLNFEARGTSGPSMMFETSSPNANLIPHFAKATPHPVANSLMYTVYKLLPNDTDMSVTKRAGLKGLNFAFTKDYLNYHTMQDRPENLSLASLQHQGTNLLGNIRHFGNISFSLDSSSEYVYFNSAAGDSPTTRPAGHFH
ncbi:MAG: M20/M25/M40 family metallo-hydrolase [Fodinibius sp.]|nr:M20/M25/M40 family metallo-hydrolase [Fodinibius sp.]